MNRGALYYAMIPLVMAASLFQSTAATRVKVFGVKPDVVLLLVVAGTLIYGSRSGLLWAFIGGLLLDVFSGGPMGASSLGLMAAVLVAGVGHRTLSRYNLLVPLGAAALGTLVYSATYLAILAVLEYLRVSYQLVPLWPTVQNIVVPALVYNTTLMILLLPLLNRVPESQDL
ncbi:MAG TPA: rod shape-determining protein MreD [Caldilineaceae bacterium]|nr:rod shape-determining protein MreD [Caldilineaceae bacterium]